jgi:hypothetical protein
MKKTILSLVMITGLFTATTFATDEKQAANRELTSKVVAMPATFSALVIHDVNIVLTNDQSSNIRVEGDQDAVKSISIKNMFGGLTIMGKRKFASDERVTVYVPARMLKNIQVNGLSKLTSNEPLSNKSLDVLINGACKVALKSYGELNVEGSDNCDLVFETK